MQTEQRYKTIRGAALAMGVPMHRVREWAKTGKLAGFTSGNRFYIDTVAFQKMLDEGRLNGMR